MVRVWGIFTATPQAQRLHRVPPAEHERHWLAGSGPSEERRDRRPWSINACLWLKRPPFTFATSPAQIGLKWMFPDMARLMLRLFPGNMDGFIQTRHLITRAPTIVREFGVRVYLRCLFRLCRPGRATFLESIR